MRSPCHVLLGVTIQAKKILSRGGQNLYHNLFSTTSADDFIRFLEHPLFVALPGKVSPSSRHLYPLIRIVIYGITPAGVHGEAPGIFASARGLKIGLPDP